MKIDRIELLPADMPQADPQWRFAIHANRVSQGWLVAITADDGTLGYAHHHVIICLPALHTVPGG